MPRRKITAETIAEMAKLCAKMLTETESCRRLGIRPRSWFDFKSRCGRGDKFAELLEAFRAQKIESLLDRVQKSADGVDTKYPDFRAALALLKFHDQKRFGDSPMVDITNQVFTCPLSPDQLAKVEKILFQPGLVVAPPATVKQIEDSQS